MRLLPSLLIAALLVGGCSGAPSANSTPSLTPTPRPTPTPTPTPKPVLTPKPVKLLPIKLTSVGREPLTWPEQIGPDVSSTVSADEAILLRMSAQTVLMAGYQAKTKVICPGGGPSEDAGTIRCTVRYRTLSVPWALTTEYTEPTMINPTRYVTYTAHPLKGILTAQNVYSSFWATHNGMGTESRCGKLPELILVDLRKDTRYRCQYLQPASGQTPPIWVSVPIRLTAEGKLDFVT